MAETSGFFNAHVVNGEHDRVYLAEQFAKYFASFIGNGVFGGKLSELLVVQHADGGMKVAVLPGMGWINGFWYENSTSLSIDVAVSDGVASRIDNIVIRWGKVERKVWIDIVTGVPATNAVAPAVTRNSEYYELKIAEINVKAGLTSITQENIVDTRLNSEVCGFVTGIIDQIDTTEFGEQIGLFIENFKVSSIARMSDVLAVLEEMAKSNDVANLVFEINNLKSLYLEDVNYPGCYYRILEDGETEWINPPLEYGVEYRTTERYKGMPVYVKSFYAARMPNTSALLIETHVNSYDIVSLEGRAIDTVNSSFHTIPFAVPNQSIPACIFSSVEFQGELLVYSNRDMSDYEGFFTLKYVKP